MGASRRAAVLAGLGALVCAFAGCEALLGLNDFSVRDCSNDACEEAGAADGGVDADANADAGDSTADVASDTSDGGSDGGSDGADASDAPDEGSGDVVVAEAEPDVAPPTVTQIWIQWVMPNPDAAIALGSTVQLPNPMSYAPDDAGRTVLDQKTHLTWEASGSPALKYEDAETHCSLLASSTSQPWRVPTRIELVSLIDWTRVPMFDVDAFAYDPDAGTGQPMGTYWTSSLAVPPQGGPLPADASPTSWGWHWTVSFATGAVVQRLSADSVRCVSGGS
jgi:hypothetical protein